MKYSVIKINNNGGMAGGFVRVYTSKSMDEILELLNEGKFFKITHECSKDGKKTFIVNPSFVSDVSEVYAERGGYLGYFYFGYTASEAEVNAKRAGEAYLIH